jgi:hypothetical protein
VPAGAHTEKRELGSRDVALTCKNSRVTGATLTLAGARGSERLTAIDGRDGRARGLAAILDAPRQKYQKWFRGWREIRRLNVPRPTPYDSATPNL